MSATIRSRRIISSNTDLSSINNAITILSNNEYKICYFESVNSDTGSITIPTGATILLNQLPGGADALVSTESGGYPTGKNPVTAGGVLVDVSTFDSLGAYTLTGIPSSYPVDIIYWLKIKAIDYSNLNINNILTEELVYVKGPISSTNNAIATFNGTAGSNIQNNSLATIDSSGNITATGLNLTSLTASQTVVTDGSKNLTSLAYSIVSSASSIVQRDANQNAFANNFVSKATNVVSAGGTTILTAGSSRKQNLTGSSVQTFQLPDATTLAIGATFDFNNNSTQLLTITNNGGTTITTIPSGGAVQIYAIAVSTSNGAWDYHYFLPSNSTWGTSGIALTGTITGATSYNGLIITANTGVITTGTWNASVIGLTYGGTNANLTASNGGIFYSTATAGAILAGTATAGKLLRSGSTAAPTWSTATFPDTATTTGAYLRADGTNWITSTLILPNAATINQIVHASAANTYGGSANFVWDTSNSRLGVNRTPSYAIDVSTTGGANARINLAYSDNANGFGEVSFTDTTSGNLKWGFGVVADSVATSALKNAFYIYQYRDQSEGVVNTYRIAVDDSGRFGVGMGTTALSGRITIGAGAAGAGLAPLKLTSGTNLTTAEAGAMEYNGTNLFFTRTGTTRQTVLTANVVTTEIVVSDTTITVNINGTDYKLLARA